MTTIEKLNYVKEIEASILEQLKDIENKKREILLIQRDLREHALTEQQQVIKTGRY